MLSSCLKNDIPFPKILAQFLKFETEDARGGAVIDAKNLTVTVNLTEQANLREVIVTDYEITEDAEISQDLDVLDLTNPVQVTLKLYHEYEWTIVANQPIERYFTVAGQIGSSIIDVEGKRVVVYVPKSTDVSHLSVTSMKLGPAEITTYDRKLVGHDVDFTKPYQLTVSYNGEKEFWTIYVEKSDQDIELTAVDAWARVIWAYANAEEGKENGFEYRKATDADWTRVDASQITVDGGSLTARINGVQSSTDYVVRAYSGDLVSAEMTVTTEPELTIPNMGFEDWWLDGKMYCPWKEGDSPFWGTGNKGSTTLGQSITVPTTDTWNGKGIAAELDTRFVGIGIVGKLGTGNIFTGDYVRTDGTNGVLNFGRPFTSRPTRLRGHWKYENVPISHASGDYAKLKGQPDTAQIYIALTDWQGQYEIRTNPQNRQLFDPNSDAVIAYGTIMTGNAIKTWSDFVVDLKYRSTSRKPTHILIVCAASKYGDFFTGGDGSTLWIDDFSLEWDY